MYNKGVAPDKPNVTVTKYPKSNVKSVKTTPNRGPSDKQLQISAENKKLKARKAADKATTEKKNKGIKKHTDGAIYSNRIEEGKLAKMIATLKADKAEAKVLADKIAKEKARFLQVRPVRKSARG